MSGFAKVLSASAWLLCIALALPGNGTAQEKSMYRWTDENGVVHFTDIPPEGVDASAQQLPENRPSSTASPYQENSTGPSAAQQRRDEIAGNAKESKAKQANLERQCAAWQAEVNRLQPSRNVYQTNAKGETERMDDVVRTSRVAELKAQIAKNCR